MSIEVSGAKLFVLRSGPASGTAIIAIGGWIGSSGLWQEPLADLSDSFVTIAYHHRRSGFTIVRPTDARNPKGLKSNTRTQGGHHVR